MNRSTQSVLAAATVALLATACPALERSGEAPVRTRQECPADRPSFCLRLDSPVCATRDNGVRCITTPCPSTDEVTYANDCDACADPRVYSYVAGECAEGAP